LPAVLRILLALTSLIYAEARNFGAGQTIIALNLSYKLDDSIFW